MPTTNNRSIPLPASETTILDKIQTRQAVVGVIGLGYVGLPLVRTFSKAGFRCVGYDVDEAKVHALNAGQSYIKHIPSQTVADLVQKSGFRATANPSDLRACDAILICVPTPLNKTRDPDMTYVEQTARMIAQHLQPGQLIILESTTYPGTTRELVQPILEAGGLRAEQDYFLAYSPEREDPGRKDFSTETIPKVVGGIGPKSTRIAEALYAGAITRVVPVANCEVAEAAKILENVYRCVNIAMVNELKVLFDRMGIDVWEVIRAASTKPFGFQAFYPGPGLGGHCIPIDPFYLSWKARASGFEARFIELAGHVNGHMPDHVIELVGEALNQRGRAIRGSKVLVLGVAYKADIDDVRESPSLDIMEKLRERGARIEYCDPFVSSIRFAGGTMRSVPFTAASLRRYDCAVIATAHKAFKYSKVLAWSKAVVDTRNALKGRRSAKIVRL